LKAIAEKTDPRQIKGIAYKDSGIVAKTPDRELIVNLDTIPFPSHELFITPTSTRANLLTSRGCPFKCNFCCLHAISKRIFRKRSVGNIIDEVEYILSKFKNITTIQISDDTFTLDTERTIDFCREVIRRKIRVKFLCSARIKPVNKEMFVLMEKAGFSSIGFGLETGSPSLLETIHKQITQEDVVKLFEVLKQIKIDVSMFLIVGFPGESNETVNETIELIKKLSKIMPFGTSGAQPLLVYPDTEVYQIMEDHGAIDDNYWLSDADTPYYTVDHPFKTLLRMSKKINHYDSPVKQFIYYYGYHVKKYTKIPVRWITNLNRVKYLTNLYKRPKPSYSKTKTMITDTIS